MRGIAYTCVCSVAFQRWYGGARADAEAVQESPHGGRCVRREAARGEVRAPSFLGPGWVSTSMASQLLLPLVVPRGVQLLLPLPQLAPPAPPTSLLIWTVSTVVCTEVAVLPPPLDSA